jgi:hypothetical protein
MTQAVKKAAPLFETDIYALIAVANTSLARQDTVYLFEAQRKEVVSQRAISSTVSDVHFVRYDKRDPDRSIHKADGVIFFGFDEVYICEPEKFEVLRVIKSSSNVGECNSLLQYTDISKLAFRSSSKDIIKVVNFNGTTDDEHFQPFKDNESVSLISFSDKVRVI